MLSITTIIDVIMIKVMLIIIVAIITVDAVAINNASFIIVIAVIINFIFIRILQQNRESHSNQNVTTIATTY